MDANWYVLEMMVDEELRTQRANAEAARLAAIPRRSPTCRLIGTVLIRLGRKVVAESGSPPSERTARSALSHRELLVDGREDLVDTG